MDRLVQFHSAANLEWDIENTPAAKFRLVSITKRLTAASILPRNRENGVLLIYFIKAEPLSKDHGGMLRLGVPGRYGVSSPVESGEVRVDEGAWQVAALGEGQPNRHAWTFWEYLRTRPANPWGRRLRGGSTKRGSLKLWPVSSSPAATAPAR